MAEDAKPSKYAELEVRLAKLEKSHEELRRKLEGYLVRKGMSATPEDRTER